jgi:hypothetical protein
MEDIRVGDVVILKSDTLPEWLNGVEAKVLMAFSEPNSYTGENVDHFSVSAAGRVVRVQRHEMTKKEQTSGGPQLACTGCQSEGAHYMPAIGTWLCAACVASLGLAQ